MVRMKHKAVKTFQVQWDKCDSQSQFIYLLEAITEEIPYRLCLFIDEFEGIPRKALDNFLQTLRNIYLSKQTDTYRSKQIQLTISCIA